MKIYEKAPAKINLLLDVLRKREDGYHEVEMIMTMVDLADRLEMEELPRDTIIISSQAGYIPLDEKNLAFQAARLIKERYDVRKGVYIHLDKKIPVAAGLAGGSSDAAAALRGSTGCGSSEYRMRSFASWGQSLVQMSLFVLRAGLHWQQAGVRNCSVSAIRLNAGSCLRSRRSMYLLLMCTAGCAPLSWRAILPPRTCCLPSREAPLATCVHLLAMCLSLLRFRSIPK